MRHRLVSPDRYEAAIRLERSGQRIRECARWGFVVTAADCDEARAAREEYDAATAAAHL